MKKKILFLLPGIANSPIGGYKVVYEYANRLVENGYDVSVAYPAYMHVESDPAIMRFLRICKAVLRFLYCRITKKHSCRNWFGLDERVKELMTCTLLEKHCPEADIYVATSVHTAYYLNEYKRPCRRFYLIQHYESWGGITDAQLRRTYSFPLKKIVISQWLYDIVSKYDPDCTLIPNGFDFDFFKKNTNVKERDRYCVAMMYHTLELKGCSEGFEALKMVKAKFPQLKVLLFGAYKKPANLPDWIEYFYQPDKEAFNAIYNSAAIFVGTSRSEGWGLTVGEAMMCGCAVVCTDNDGYKEMAKDGETALMSPINDSIGLSRNIVKLIENDVLRYDIADRGHEFIQKFNWDDSFGKLMSLING